MSKYFIPTGCVGVSYSPVIHIKNAYDRLEAESKANTKLTRERGLNVICALNTLLYISTSVCMIQL